MFAQIGSDYLLGAFSKHAVDSVPLTAISRSGLRKNFGMVL